MKLSLQNLVLGVVLTAVAIPTFGSAQVTILRTFNPSASSDLCGMATAPVNEDVWVYECFGAMIQRYSSTGTFLLQIPRPGESANDVDLEVAPEGLTLGTTSIPQGTLLFCNGESGVAEIYALDPNTGSILATLVSAFGVSHVVGCGYHTSRDTFFLLQDKVPGGTSANRVAEIDPATGNVLNTFQTSPAGFIVNFGDLDVSATGNLLLVSSDESSVAEFTPTGTLVSELSLPSGVATLSGLGTADMNGTGWVAGNNGIVWRLGALPGCGAACAILSFCSGDGSVTACPCGNAGSPGRGCANSIFGTGALLAGTGSASIGGDTLQLNGSGMPNSSALYFQGTTAQGGGIGSVFGDGLRCAAGTIIRLATKANTSNASVYPEPSDPPVSVRGLVTTPGVRTYQAWYRNAADFCTASTFNLTNALSVTWAP